MAVYLVPGVFGAGGQIFDTNGKAAGGALINTYAAGTTSTVATFTTNLGTITAANPIVCSADGRLPAEMWQTQGQAIKIIVTDSLLNTLGTYDNLYGIGDPSATNAAIGYYILTSVAGINTITAASAASLASLTNGELFIIIPAATNTGATTINITPSGGSALGAKNIFANGVALTGGELVINVPAILDYDGTRFNILGIVKSYYFDLGTVGGSANTLTATGPTNLATLASGQLYTMKPISVNTGATTLNVTPSGSSTALGAKSIFFNGSALTGSEFATSVPVILYYDGTQYNAFSKASFPVAASQAQQEAGSSTAVFTAPGVQQYHPSAAKFWVNFNGTGTVTTRATYNVSSITDGGTGIYTVNTTINFSSANYCAVSAGRAAAGGVGGTNISNETTGAGTIAIRTMDNAASATDFEFVYCVGFGDQ